MRRDLLAAAALASMLEPPKRPDPEPRRAPRYPGLEPWQKDMMDATMHQDTVIDEATPRVPRAVWAGDPETLSRAEAKRARKNEKRLRERQ